MTVTITSGRTWTSEEIDHTMVKLNGILSCLKRRHTVPTDCSIESAIETARRLAQHLEQYPRACTAEALATCRELIDRLTT